MAEGERAAEPFLSHSFDSQFTRRSQPGGRDFEEERSVAGLNLKCQMCYFDFMEKKKKDSSEDPADHMLPSSSRSLPEKKKKSRGATGTDRLFHRASGKQRGASALKASDT